MVTGGVCVRLQNNATKTDHRTVKSQLNETTLKLRNFSPGNSWLHRLPEEVKLITLLIVAVGLLISPTLEFTAGGFVLLAILLPLAHTPVGYLLETARRYRILILISFLMPLFFNAGTHVLVRFAGFELTLEGLTTGARFATRILLLVMTSALLVRTTSPDQIVGGLARLLRPMRLFGISSQRIATLLSLSWVALPSLWKATRDTIASVNMKDIKNVKQLLPLLSDLIATLYRQTEPAHGLWNQDPKNGQAPIRTVHAYRSDLGIWQFGGTTTSTDRTPSQKGGVKR
jgi:energy-coupling factor transporter transmembrane protein EcfT